MVDQNLTQQHITKHSNVVGIHLSGPNAKKSAVVVLTLEHDEANFESLYEKIGSVGSLFSDERIIEILKLYPNLHSSFVDCPISEPPCVHCDRPVCPGVVRCEDVAVGMMMSIEQHRKRKGGHKLRPLNPQNLRLWDAMYGRGADFGNMEPTYSANLAPLVVRARTLQRRFRSVMADVSLQETNVPFLLKLLEKIFNIDSWTKNYRNFELGFQTRCDILSVLSSNKTKCEFKKLHIGLNDESLDEVASSVETFHAFMASAMGVWAARGLAQPKTQYFEANEGWVELLATELTSQDFNSHSF